MLFLSRSIMVAIATYSVCMFHKFPSYNEYTMNQCEDFNVVLTGLWLILP